MTPFTGHLTDEQAQRLCDGALPEAEATLAEAHAGRCAACGALVESYRILGAALEDLELPELPADFTAGVLDRIDQRERLAARERRVALGVCAAALVAIAAVAAVAIGGASWTAAVTGLADRLGATGRALRLAAEVLPPVLSAVRVPLAVACAVAFLPLLFALSRLMTPSPRTELA